ncbi:MAG TPA: helix-turn-helix domain-containing protein [Candidatus Nanoarchaeia archaeon]|nr:helix-turn-helix domain-containing protein [Candidatus Nanoarchaeia archaeon]
MITRFQKITLVKLRSPQKNVNQEIQWLSESLGLFSERDKDKSCFRLFLEIIKTRKPVSSDELASRVNVSRATVIHHLNKLIATGLVDMQDNKYVLRGKNLESTLKQVKTDMLAAYEEMEEIARKIDQTLGL